MADRRVARAQRARVGTRVPVDGPPAVVPTGMDGAQDRNSSPVNVALHDELRDELRNELRDAIRHRDLALHYQPAIDLRTGQIVGVEALVRWNHPTRGLLSPDSFVPLAEREGLIGALTRAVLDQSVRFLASTMDPAHASSLGLRINISAQDLDDPDFAVSVREVLIAYRFPAERLTLEIAERSVETGSAQAHRTIRTLRDEGIRVAIDDFGHTSLSPLLAATVDELKLDRSIVELLPSASRAEAIIRATVEVALTFGLRVVAVGVESADVQDRLAALGCDVAQGFWIARPMPGPALVELLERPSWHRRRR